MAISEELELDISGALDAIESLNDSLTGLGESLTVTLTGAIEAVDVTPLVEQLAALDASGLTTTIDAAIDATDGTVPIDADTSAVPGEIDASIAEADTIVTVEADVSDFGGSIDEALAAADTSLPIVAEVGDIGSEIETEIQSADTTIVIEADTAALEEITTNSGDATLGLEGVTGASGDLQAAASGNLGAGALGGLTSTLGKAGPLGAAGAVGLGIFTVGVKTLFDLAVPAVASLQRFNDTFGPLAKIASRVKLGGLNSDLGDLAIRLGSDDEGLQDAASSLFQFGKAAGFTSEQSLELVNNASALAARAVALNPALGEVGDVAASISNAFARGGKFASKYGLSLTAAEINARALANTGKATVADLTIQDKAFAGSQIAAEKYGKGIDKEITKGSKSAIIEQRRLKVEMENIGEEAGKPLVFPIQKFMREMLPIVKALAPVFADLAKDTLPILAQSLKDATPTIKFFGDLLRQLAPILGPLQKLINITVNPVGALAEVFRSFGDLPDVAGFFTGIGEAITGFLGAVVGFGADLIDSFLVGIKQAFPAVISFFANLGTTIFSTIGDVLTSITQKGTDIITGLFTGITSAVVAVFNFFRNLSGTIFNTIGNVAGTLAQKGVDLIGGLLGGLRSAAEGLFTFFQKLPRRMFDAVGNVASFFGNVGRAIINGIKTGLTELLPNLLTFIKNKVVGAIKRIPFIGGLIGSPSPFFREVGKAMDEGLVQGIAGSLASVEKAGESLVAAATPSISAISRLPAVAAALPVSAGAAAAVAAGTTTSITGSTVAQGNGGVVINVHTTNPDPVAVGLETVRQLRAESFRSQR